MKVKTININGVSMSEVQTELGSVNVSTSQSKSIVDRITPGLAIKYVEHGKENYRVKNKDLSVSSGQFFLLRNDTYFKAASNNITKGCCVNLNVDSFQEIDRILENELLFEIPFTSSSTSKLGMNLNNFVNEISFNAESVISKIPNLSDVVESFSESIYSIDDKLSLIYKKKSTKQSIVEALFKSREYIHQNYSKKITLNELVRISCLSKYHFLRLFSRCFGVTPLQMQQDIRMNLAAKMVQNQTKSLTEIAFLLGYIDLASFSNNFKVKFGMPPSKFVNR